MVKSKKEELGNTVEPSSEGMLQEALEGIKLLNEQMEIDRAAFKAELDDFRAENTQLKREATKTVQDSVDALAAMRNRVDQANAAMFDKRKAESAERCKEPLSETEREAWRDLERRAKTHGFDEQPSPAEMTTLGEYRIRAKIGD